MTVVGAAFAIGAAVLFALSNVAIVKEIDRTGVRIAAAVQLVGGAVLAAVAAIALDGAAVLAAAPASALVAFAVGGGIHFVGRWVFVNASIIRIGAARASAMTGITPMVASLLALLALGESVGPEIMIGMIAIVAGTYLVTTS
jgi:drug/metabolite transporter (DMT)-like permease